MTRYSDEKEGGTLTYLHFQKNHSANWVDNKERKNVFDRRKIWSAVYKKYKLHELKNSRVKNT